MEPVRRSLDTTASGLIPDSIISLSAFPDTPTATSFNPAFRRQLPPIPPGSARSSPTSHSPRDVHRAFTPHDWHEGASSISQFDDRLPGLTTAFITNAISHGSDDALTQASGITYPPSSPPPTSILPVASTRARPPPLRIFPDARPPPSSFVSPNAPSYIGSISEEDFSVPSEHHGHIHSDVRTTSLRQSFADGTQVVGVAPATIVQTLSKRSSEVPIASHSNLHRAYASHPLDPALPSTREGRYNDSSSQRSKKSYIPSFVSSSAHSLHKIYNRFARHPRRAPPPPLASDLTGTVSPVKSHEGYNYSISSSHLPILSKHEGVSSSIGGSISRSSRPLWQGEAAQGLSPLHHNFSPDSPKVHRKFPPVTTRKGRLILILIIFVVLAVAGIVAGVVVSVKAKTASSVSCSGNMAGSDCSLDATCVCTSSISGRCDGMAQNLVDLVPSANTIFQTNFSQAEVYNAVWLAVGSSKNCVNQANTVDLSTVFDKASSPNRLLFAQSAMLWNLVQSVDLSATQKIRSFILNAPWSSLHSLDDIENSDSFAVTVSGFTFDFAAQSVSQPSVSFVSSASPSSEQLAKVGPGARDVLDRMYSVARASASQRKSALSSYWSTTLQQSASDLNTFMSAFLNSPILVPFDAESDKIQEQLRDNSSSTFPPPLACTPGLSSSQLSRVNALESSVFALPNVTSAEKFDANCYGARPTYGRLDILQLRLPFLEEISHAPKQALALKRDAGSRLVLYPWEINSPLPSIDLGSSLSNPQLDYRQYGTMNSAEHVVLDFLKSIGDINLATSVVKFMLRNPTAPPTSEFAVDQIPIIEVAIFGSLDKSDFTAVTTSFSTKSSSVFFGSANAGTLRDWALPSLSLNWAEAANSTQVVRQTSSSSDAFNAAWKAASDSLQNNIAVSVQQITDSLTSTGQFTQAFGFG